MSPRARVAVVLLLLAMLWLLGVAAGMAWADFAWDGQTPLIGPG